MCLFCLCIGKVVLQDRRFLVDHFFPFRSLNISAHCLLASNVLLRNQLWILLGSPCMFSVIFLLFLKNYFLCLWVFLWICDLGVDLFVWPNWSLLTLLICRFPSYLVHFSLFFLDFFFFFFAIFSLFSLGVIVWLFMCLMVSHSSVRLFIFLYTFSSLFPEMYKLYESIFTFCQEIQICCWLFFTPVIVFTFQL